MTKKLTASAMLIALSAILSLIKLFNAPYGGTITAASMVPVILIGILYGTKWGLLSGFIYGLLQMLTGGIAPPPVQSVYMYTLVIVLDYLVAFTVLGLSGFFFNLTKKNKFSLAVSGAIVIFLRFICHFISGILIWGVYAPEGTPVWIYSILYNGGYMFFEMIISVFVLCMLKGVVKKIL